ALVRSQACRAQAPQSLPTGLSDNGVRALLPLLAALTLAAMRDRFHGPPNYSAPLAHGRRNLNQFCDLRFRQWRLNIPRGYRLFHDRIETDDPVRRQHVLGVEFIAQAPGESFRYASELGVAFERRGIGIHPVNGLAIGLHKACKNILAFLQSVHIGDHDADGVASDGGNVACSRHDADFSLLDGLEPEWGLCPANVDVTRHHLVERRCRSPYRRWSRLKAELFDEVEHVVPTGRVTGPIGDGLAVDVLDG